MFNINVCLNILGRVCVKGQISGFYKDMDILNSECHIVKCSNYLPIKVIMNIGMGKIQAKQPVKLFFGKRFMSILTST